jgi:hypothetical protein
MGGALCFFIRESLSFGRDEEKFANLSRGAFNCFARVELIRHSSDAFEFLPFLGRNKTQPVNRINL